MNIPAAKPMTLYQKIKFSISAVIWAALLIALFVLTLALLTLLSQTCADALGYTFVISDEVAKATIAVGGATVVGFIALYGVQLQNFGAEKRHKVDSSLALRKEIFLQVAAAYSVQYQYLLSFAIPAKNPENDTAEEERANMIKDINKSFFQLQAVASQETICAMLDCNEEWTRIMLHIRFSLGPTPPKPLGPLERLMEIQKLTTPFMRKLWHFNMIARKEIESEFNDDDDYLSMMGEKFSHVEVIFEELKQTLATKKD